MNRKLVSMETLMPNLGKLVSVGAVLLLAGCGSSTLQPADGSMDGGKDQGQKFTGPPSDAGLEVKQNTDVNDFKKLVASNSSRFVARSDPFALKSSEKAFDYQQEGERVFSQNGGFQTFVEPKVEVAPAVQIEQQPYRRLSGVVVGDSVLAIIEMGNGAQPEIVRPGQKIPNSDWTVVSIDQDKAILQRDGNVLPKEITVRLEVPPYGTTPATPPPAGGGNLPPGAGGRFPGAAGGFPGGPGGFPGGRFPGGPGGRGGRGGRFGGGGGRAGG